MVEQEKNKESEQPLLPKKKRKSLKERIIERWNKRKEKLKQVNINGKLIYLNPPKLLFGWKVIAPPINEDNTINWPNLIYGGKRNLFYLIFMLLLMGGIIFGVNEMIKGDRAFIEHPCIQSCALKCNDAGINNYIYNYSFQNNYTKNLRLNRSLNLRVK